MKIDLKELKRQILEFRNKRDNLVYNTSKTSIETKLSKSEKFIKSELYKNIIDSTDFLPSDVTIYHRIKVILDGIDHIPICPICNKRPLKICKNFKKWFFKKDCGEKECTIRNMVAHIKPQSKDLKDEHRITIKNFRNKIRNLQEEIYNKYNNNEYDIIPYEEIRKIIIARKNNQKTTTALIKNDEYENSHDLICSILYHTRFIKTVNELDDLTNNFFKFSERTYCIYNDIRKYKSCEVCGDPVTNFDKNWKIGYRSVCSTPSCGTHKAAKHRSEKNMTLFKDKLKEYGYELLSDNKNKQEKGTIKHSCGHVFNINLAEIFLNSKNSKIFRNFDRLCPKCHPRENLVSKWEIEVRNYINENIENSHFSFNNRELLSPYEIDILDNTNKIGIECDGVEMHSSKYKDDDFHRWKTDACEELGYELLHILDCEWYMKKDVVKSLICRKYSLFDKIKNSECKIMTINEQTAENFYNENSVLIFENTRNNFGIFYNDDMIGMYSTINENNKTIIRNICKKNYIDVENMISLIETNVKNKIIEITDDRRLFQFKNDILNSGFRTKRVTKSKCIRMNNIEIHRLHDVYFRGGDTSIFNVANIKCIDKDYITKYFDCGNMVFVKEY